MAKLDSTLVGKMVKVYLPKMKYRGSGVVSDASYIVGKCTFAGINRYTGKMQITVDRTPIFPVREEDVEVLD